MMKALSAYMIKKRCNLNMSINMGRETRIVIVIVMMHTSVLVLEARLKY